MSRSHRVMNSFIQKLKTGSEVLIAEISYFTADAKYIIVYNK